jgi:uncharacterized protein
MIVDLQKQISEALKSGDSVRLSTLRLLSSELHNAEIAKIGKLTEDEELAIIRKEVKKRRDAIELYERGGRPEKAESERLEIVILQEFLPSQLTDEALAQIVNEVIVELSAKGMGDMGKVIGKVMERAKGQAEGSKVSQLVKEKLAQ